MRRSTARSTSFYWHTSALSLSLTVSVSHSKIAVDEEASRWGRRDFAHCAAIIPVTRDTPGGLPDEILEEASFSLSLSVSRRSESHSLLATLRVVLDPRYARKGAAR